MKESQRDALITAQMLLEMATDGGFPPSAAKFGGEQEFMCAAHSYIQVALGGQHSWDGAEEMVARIYAADAIQIAARRKEGV